jgi:hypothetical protein
MAVNHTLCYYTVQLAYNLHVHTKYQELRPLAPILFLAGGVGSPTDTSFYTFLEWCATHWQRVYICAGEIEDESALQFMAVCRHFSNVCVVDVLTTDTHFESLCVTSQGPVLKDVTTVALTAGCMRVYPPDAEEPTVITQPGVHQVSVTPMECAYTVKKGWAKVCPRPQHHRLGHCNSCRTCGYSDHKPWDCPVSQRDDYKYAT